MVKPMTPAQKQLAEDHMDLVPKIIRSMTNGSPLTSEQRQELCQIGYLALCRAAVSCGEGFPFTPYAAAAIRNAIYDSWRHEIRVFFSRLKRYSFPSAVRKSTCWFRVRGDFSRLTQVPSRIR